MGSGNMRIPPPNRQTGMTENFTFPQTMYAVGEYHGRSQSLGSKSSETPLWHQQLELNNKKPYQNYITGYVILNLAAGGRFYIHTLDSE